MENRLSFALIVISAASSWSCKEAVSPQQKPATVKITVDPHLTRSIAGESELDRKRYFAICDSGVDLDKRFRQPEHYDELVKELKISFGRVLGPLGWLTRNQNIVREDPSRPEFTDINQLRDQLSAQRAPQSTRMLGDFGPNLDVAAHGNHGAFPDFMGRILTDTLRKEGGDHGGKSEHLPENIQAAAELAAAVFKHNYDDFTRPRFFEPVNEPHWSYLTHPEHIAKWHLATMERMHAEVPGVMVGGPCNAVGYFYSDNYQAFGGLKNFIDATGGQMDFYSFHVYDYYKWQDTDFGGSFLSGLPLEGILDLVPNYTSITYGHGTPIVVSETGGYLNDGSTLSQHEQIEKIATKLMPGSGFEWQMKARSIHEFIHTRSTIANILAFMDHPQTVKKAVPFMLYETSQWDPKYYAALYVKQNFDPQSNKLIPSSLLNFYRLFRDLQGRRVKATCDDPDIQMRAFVDGSRLLVVAHNLAAKPEILGIAAPQTSSVNIRRYGRNDDLTPYLREESGKLASISLGPFETVVVTANYESAIESARTLEETIHYGTMVTVPVKDDAKITIPLKDATGIDHASLRIGYNRPAGSSPEIRVLLNGSEVKFPIEDSASRYDDAKHGYSTTKIVSVDPSLLKTSNSVVASFPDGGGGMIGSAVIRIAK